MTAVQLQMEYLEQSRKYVEDRFGADVDEMTKDVLDRWESVLHRLGDDPMQLSRELDWVAKLALLEGYRSRDNLDWSHPRLHLVDLQYADIRPDKGLYNRLVDRGRIERFITEAEVEAAIDDPPEDTRATSAAAACASTPTPSPPPPGTPSSSTSRAASPCSASRPWSPARHQGARGRSPGPLPHRRRPGGHPDRPELTHGRTSRATHERRPAPFSAIG